MAARGVGHGRRPVEPANPSAMPPRPAAVMRGVGDRDDLHTVDEHPDAGAGHVQGQAVRRPAGERPGPQTAQPGPGAVDHLVRGSTAGRLLVAGEVVGRRWRWPCRSRPTTPAHVVGEVGGDVDVGLDAVVRRWPAPRACSRARPPMVAALRTRPVVGDARRRAGGHRVPGPRRPRSRRLRLWSVAPAVPVMVSVEVVASPSR